jgi:hypothetical protein
VLADTGSSKKKEYVQLTAWKKHHKLGKFTVDPALLKPPLDHWATREFSLAHVQKLARAFMDHGKTNEKGIRVIVTSPVLYAEWHAATQAEKDDMLQPGSVFHAKIMSSGLHCPTGDHTAHALVQLQASHPHETRWFQLTKVKFFLMKGDSEDAHFARLTGNTDNERRGLQKSVDVVDMLVQLHMNHVGEKVLAMKGGYSKTSKSKRNVEYIKDRCKKWEVNEATMRALQGLGNLEGEEWAMFHQILKGEYPSAAHNKDGSCIPLQTHSQFTSFPALDPPLRLMLLRNIINGSARVQNLRTECLRHVASHRIRKEILTIINTKCRTKAMKARDELPAATWEKASVLYPNATSLTLQQEWVPGFSKLPQKAPVPKTFSNAVLQGITQDEAALAEGAALKVHMPSASRHYGIYF